MKALVTGASSGIGKQIAIYLSELGYDIVAVARTEEGLQELKQQLSTNTEIFCMDISKKENCYELFEKVQDVDILVNNAGFGLYGVFSKTDLDKEINMIGTNVEALHILTKLYLRKMVDKNKGKILNVASIAGFMPGPLMATYYATKNYVVALSRAINKELKKEKLNVKISILCPGPVNTNFNNVAGVKFGVKPLDSKYVAKYAVDKMLKGKLLIIPGLSVKLAKLGIKIVPSSVAQEVAYNLQKAKEK